MKAARPREDNDALRVSGEAIEGAAADDGEAEEDEGDEQPGMARGDQAANGERRPRRRGRRGGRRRRGNGPEDGLAGSIADELGPTSAPEAASAVADFDGGSSEPAPSLVEPEPVSRTGRSRQSRSLRAYAQPEPVETVTASTAPLPDRRGNRAGGRPGRGAAAFDRARESQLHDERAGRARAARQPQRSRAGRAARACPGRARSGLDRRSRPAQGGLVVAALRQRRVRIKPKKKNRPAKPGGFFIGSRGDRYPVVSAVSTSDGSICLFRLACSLS